MTLIRLLSSDPSSRAGLPRRSRTAKVQLHVVTVTCKETSWEIPVELEGLVDKTAPTLATSFERLLKTLLDRLGGQRNLFRAGGRLSRQIFPEIEGPGT